jgi:fibronectin-binding autotransporter adhesin
MADRFWVGGTASWDATAGTKWAATSGGAGGQSVPTSADDVFFDAASGAVTCTVSATATCANLNFTGFTGTFAGSSQVQAYGSLVCGSGMTWSYTGTLVFVGPGTLQITCNGKTIGPIQISSTGTPTVELQDAFASSGSITISGGTFTTNNFNVTATQLSSSNSNTRTINLGSSTVTLSLANTSINFATQTNLTFNSGTSQIVCTNNAAGFAIGSGVTFYNVSFTATGITTVTVQGANTFNNLSVTGRTTTGISALSVNADQTINGTLTLSAGTDATRRAFVRSNTIGTTRTLTCAAVASLTDIDFRDITIAGAAAPVSGTRLGDCKGNSGITFDAAKTVYYRGALNANWNSLVWSFTNGGTADVTAFPLAQDTAVFPSSPTPYPTSGNTATINADYNIGTIDMSARTGNTMTLATGSNTPAIYGNWINGTGTTITGTGVITFAGRGSQTITSAGKSFTQNFTIDTPSGSVTLQDALTGPGTASLTFTSGTFNLNTYNATVNGFSTNNSNTRTLAVGSGTLTLTGGGSVFNAATATNFTVTGTGTISMTSASAKTFAGGGIQTYPTLNQGGTGTLTVTGSNKFADITNTAIGRVQFSGGTTNIFTAFNLNGVSGNLLQLGSTNTTQATLQKSSAWLMGANSTDAGNNTGLSFTAGGGIDYLSVSYINGQVVGGGYTIAANNGTYTVTGQSATLSRSRLITSDTGYYNVVGYPATIVISGSPIIVTDQLLIKLRSFTERRRF